MAEEATRWHREPGQVRAVHAGQPGAGGRPDACALLTRLCELLDARRWADLPALLHEDFTCRYVHTGETFDRDAWVRLNADYPGFDHLVLDDLVGAGDRAAARCHVTGYAEGRLAHFEVATFVTAREGQLAAMTEVWTDVAQSPPPAARGGPAGASADRSP